MLQSSQRQRLSIKESLYVCLVFLIKSVFDCIDVVYEVIWMKCGVIWGIFPKFIYIETSAYCDIYLCLFCVISLT